MEFFSPYSQFAPIYDRSMEAVSYSKWAEYIVLCFSKRKLPLPKQILDIGCGTGRLAEELSRIFKKEDHRFHYTGVDSSGEMLEVARAKTQGSSHFHWIQSNWEDYSDETSYDLVLSTHTTLNYICDPVLFLEKARHYLKKDGVLFFDFTSRENILKNFHDKEFEESHGARIMVWKTRFEESRRLIHVSLDFLDGKTRKLLGTEYHLQYYHEPERIKKHLARLGYHGIEAGADYSRTAILNKVDMHHFFAMK